MRKIVCSLALLLGLAVSTVAQAQVDTVGYEIVKTDPIGRRIGQTLHQVLADVYAEGVFRCESYRKMREGNDYLLEVVLPGQQVRVFYQLHNGRVVLGNLMVAQQSAEDFTSSFDEWWPRIPTKDGPVWYSPWAKVSIHSVEPDLFVFYEPLPVANPTANKLPTKKH